MADDFPIDERDVNAPDEYLELKTALEKHRAAAKAAEDAERDYKSVRDKVYESMEEDGVESIRKHGQLFTRNQPTWYAVVQDEAQLEAWLKENRPSAIGSKFDAKILNGIVRACREDERPFPPGLGGYPRRVVAVRK